MAQQHETPNLGTTLATLCTEGQKKQREPSSAPAAPAAPPSETTCSEVPVSVPTTKSHGSTGEKLRDLCRVWQDLPTVHLPVGPKNGGGYPQIAIYRELLANHDMIGHRMLEV